MIIPKVAKKIIAAIHDTLFPKRCAGCQLKGSYLCQSCSLKLPISKNYNNYGVLFTVPYSLSAIKKLSWLLKYRGVKEIAAIFARWAYDAIIEDLADINQFYERGGRIIIIPVPLSQKRKRQRGFNQAEEIAKELWKLDEKLFRLDTDCLLKIKHTETQVAVRSRTARLINLRGAFKIQHKSKLRGRIIILLDDVTTTGATLSETARVLAQAKPRRIIKLAIAG